MPPTQTTCNLLHMPVGHRPQPPVGTVRVALSGKILTHQWANVFYLRFTDDGTRTINDLDSILTAIGTNYSTDVLAQLSSSFTMTSITGVWITSVGNQLSDVKTVALTGGAGAAVADAAASIVVDWKISDYYRGGHPRSYVPGVVSGNVTNGSDLSGGYLTSLATGFGALRNHINALTATHVSQVEMGTVRFQSADAWLTPPVFRPYTSVSIRAKLGTQRRRILR